MTMAITAAKIPTWNEIDQAESYLVCCMFDEASSLALSILKQVLDNNGNVNELDEMLESAGMVLVQSLKELKKTVEIMKELKLLFGSVTAIPVEVFVTGACFQMMECPSIVQGFLEEYVSNWRYEDERYYALSDVESSVTDKEISGVRLAIDVDKYLEVVELYVITLLTVKLKDIDRAISWVNNSMLPMEKRQESFQMEITITDTMINQNTLMNELLRRISSMTPTSSSQISPSLPNENKTKFDFMGERKTRSHEIESAELSSERNTTKEEILKLSRQRVPWFWWFPSAKFKFGNAQLTVPTRKILLASLLLLIYYFVRKRRVAVKRILVEKTASIKKAVLDLWQLAFSYQMNPLAAVQPLPTPGR